MFTGTSLSPVGVTYLIDKDTNSISSLACPYKVFGAKVISAVANGSVYTFVVGGLCPSACSSIAVFNHSSRSFLNYNLSLPSAVNTPGVAVVNRSLLVIGGPTNTIFVWDLSTFRISTSFFMKFSRKEPKAATLGRYVYIGGSLETDLVEVVDVLTRTTFFIGRLTTGFPVHLGYMGSILQNRVFHIGGRSSNTSYLVHTDVIDSFSCGNMVL